MEEIGNWQAATQNIWNSCSQEESSRFNGIQDEVKKVSFITNKCYIGNISWLEFYLKSCDKLHLKCSEKSVKSRNHGNKLFQEKKYSEALLAYRQSILTAPTESESLGLAYGNHSAANFYLQQYKECIADLEASLENGYPKSSAYKLYLRWAHCLYKTGHYQEALEKLNTAKSTVIGHKEIEKQRKEKLLEEIQVLDKAIHSERSDCANEEDKVDECYGLFEGKNSVLPQASSAVEMKYTKEKGRYLQAKGPIPAGSTIITEKPYASVLLPEHYETHCHHCVGKLVKIIPCRRCTMVLYCSETCREDSWSIYHMVECQFLDICHSIGIAHLSLRIVLTAGLQFLLDFRSKLTTEFYQNADRIGGIGTDGTYDRTYLSVYDLMTHSEDIETEDSFQYTLTAVLLLTVLKQSGWLDLKPIPKDPSTMENKDPNILQFTQTDLYIGSLLLRHIEQLVCNAHAITELLVTETSNSSLVDSKSQERIATAIYPTTSLLNHSCDPSIIPGFDKDLLVVRVIKDVHAGEEIFNCYGPHHKRMIKQERQQALRSQYFFTCQCTPCQTMEDQDIFMSYCCPYCRGPLQQLDNQCTCTSCNFSERLDKFTKEEELSQDLFVEGLKCLQIQNVKGAIQKFSKCLQHQSEFFYKHHKSLAETQDCLARCYAIFEQYDKAVPYLRDSVCTLGKLYGDTSIEYANELHKFAGVLYHAGEVQEGVKVIDEAIKIFTIHLGEKYELVQELTEMKICLVGKIELK